MCQLDQLPTSRCRCTASYFLSWSLLHLICFNLFHLIWCSPCHPLFGCIWRVSTPVPLLAKRQVVGTCKMACPSFGTCPTSLAIPTGWPETPDTTFALQFLTQIHMNRVSTLSVMQALLSNPFFFHVNFWMWVTTLTLLRGIERGSSSVLAMCSVLWHPVSWHKNFASTLRKMSLQLLLRLTWVQPSKYHFFSILVLQCRGGFPASCSISMHGSIWCCGIAECHWNSRVDQRASIWPWATRQGQKRICHWSQLGDD